MLDSKCHAGFLLMVALFAGGLPLSRCTAAPIEIDGVTEPYRDVTLGLADPGIIAHEFFKEGDGVKTGEAILEFDNKLEELEVTRRKAVRDQDKLVLDSTRELFQTTKSISKENLTKAEAEYNVSAAQYAIAVRQLADRRLVAPFSGHIVKILLHSGAACAPYQPLVRLVDTSRFYFVGHIDGVEASKLRMDEPVRVRVSGGETVSGKICFISPVVDPASGLARIKAIFDNNDAKVRPGLAAKMIIE